MENNQANNNNGNAADQEPAAAASAAAGAGKSAAHGDAQAAPAQAPAPAPAAATAETPAAAAASTKQDAAATAAAEAAEEDAPAARGTGTGGGAWRTKRGQDGGDPKALYVSYLPLWYTSADLRQLFETYGAVERANVVTDRETGESRGYGFVHFADAEHARGATEALNGRVLDGRPIHVGTSRSRNELKLFVSQLLPTVDAQQLETAFARFGRVVGCNVLRDHATGRSRGFGFVTMETRAARTAIRQLNGATHEALSGDRPLVVEVAESKQQLHSGSTRSGSSGTAATRAGRTRDSGATRWRRQDQSQQQQQPVQQQQQYEGVCVFIYNLPREMNSEGLRELFHKYGTVLRAHVAFNPEGTSRGYGFVNMSTLEEANNAIAGLDKRVLEGDKPLQVSLKTERRDDAQ